MSGIATFASKSIDTYQSALRDSGNAVEARRETTRVMVSAATREGSMSAERAGHLAIDSTLAYDRRSRDLPHEKAREEAVKDVTLSGKERGLDVRNYARSVIDSIRANPGREGSVLYAHASIANDDGRATVRDAGRLADESLKQYERARVSGRDHEAAREQAVRNVSARFDERGRDTQRRDREQSLGMSL